MTAPDLVVTIPGKPRTQGSLTLWRGQDGKERARHATGTMNHRNLVVGLVIDAWGIGRASLAGDVAVDILATFERPAAHYRTGRNAHLLREGAPTRPISRSAGDADKISRLACDALDIAGVYNDDSQVALLRIEKRYAEPGEGPSTVLKVWGIS